MLGHLGINVEDVDEAKRYYGALMPLLGFELFLDTPDTIAYCPAEGKRGTYLFLYQAMEPADGATQGYSRHRTGLQHLAFMVPTRWAVEEVHRLVIELGSEVLHEPQDFPQYPPPYYAFFWLDPFGFMVEAVCHYDRDS